MGKNAKNWDWEITEKTSDWSWNLSEMSSYRHLLFSLIRRKISFKLLSNSFRPGMGNFNP